MAKILIGTATTDANGVATITYEPTSVGDINIIAECENSNGTLESNIVNVDVDISNMVMELGVTGNSFSTENSFGPSSSLIFNGRVFIDWGDDSELFEYTGGALVHNYNNNDNYTIKIYGNITSLDNYYFTGCAGLTSVTIPNSVTSIGEGCFRDCSDLTLIEIPNSVTSIGEDCFRRCLALASINIPDSVTSLENTCFSYCLNLTSIILNWDTNNEILTYNQYWIKNTSSNLVFHIPHGTTSLYTTKEYPLEKLEEEIIYDEIELTTDKSILSYTDNETCILTAQLTYNNNPVNISGETIEFYNGTISMGIAQTNSSGVATKSYASGGIGDITLTAKVGSYISNSVSIEDCLYYSSPASTNAIITPWTNNCIAEYEVYASDIWNWHYLLVFQGENQELIATLSTSYDNGSQAPIKTTYFPPQNTWTPMQFKTENGTATVSSNGTVKGTTNISLSNLTSIKIYNSKSSTQQRNIKIKPSQTIVNQELIETNAQKMGQINSQLCLFKITLTLNNISDNQNIYCSINGDSQTMTKNNNSLMYASPSHCSTTYFDVILRIDPYIDENNYYWNGLSWEGTIEVT